MTKLLRPLAHLRYLLLALILWDTSQSLQISRQIPGWLRLKPSSYAWPH